MKIAAVTIFCNEFFRLQNWKTYYEEYSSEIYYHVIVNNGRVEDCDVLKDSFPKSIVVHSQTKNMVASYNLGFQTALANSEVDVVMQITNDIRFEYGAITKLYDKLMSDSKLALIGPVVLKKDSEIIESFGYIFRHHYGNGRPLFRNCPYSDLREPFIYVSSIPGGAIMIKRECYDKFGAQDENLFMYADERDMFIRYENLGYREGVLCTAKAWHQHVFPKGKGRRSTTAFFLTARNRIYIAAKHNPFYIALGEFAIRFIVAFMQYAHHIIIFQPEKKAINWATIRGLWYGILGRMDNSFMEQ